MSDILSSRYASNEMTQLFTEQYRAKMWRTVWIALAKAQKKSGLSITDNQIAELEAMRDKVNLAQIAEYEGILQHDVLAHIAQYAVQCPSAKPILHLGATSCDITDNADLLIYHQGLEILHKRSLQVLAGLKRFALEHKSTIALGYTHFQAAQPTTVGLRACIWYQDLWMDTQRIALMLKEFRLRGLRGAVGTQASFLALVGTAEKVNALEKDFLKELGVSQAFPVTGQTYPRKYDADVGRTLGCIGESAHKFGLDIRLLQHTKEMQEPFGAMQKGSSAMPYKRNPMRSERLCSLSRMLLNLPATLSQTASQQWLERSLDDSASRRLLMGQIFMLTDSVLSTMQGIIDGLVVNASIVNNRLNQELPFFVTENILMHCVRKGKDRQTLHTLLRNHSVAASAHVLHGEKNDLRELILADSTFGLSAQEYDDISNLAHYIGTAPQQVESFFAHLGQ